MAQVLHPRATTTEATRREIQNSQESINKLAKRFGVKGVFAIVQHGPS